MPDAENVVQELSDRILNKQVTVNGKVLMSLSADAEIEAQAGGVTAMGCTVGQGLSGLSTLSLTSAIAVAGIMVGAVLGFRLQIWLLERG